MAKVVKKAPVKVSPKHVTTQVDPFTGESVAHSQSYWKGRVQQYQKRYGPLDITAPMGPSDVAHSIDAAARQKFGPQYQTLSGQTQQSLGQDKNITDYYGQYRQALANATQQTQAANQAAMDFTNNFANTSSNVDAGQRAQLAQQQQASAAQRGQQVDPNQGLVGQQADQSRRAAAGSFGSLIGAQGANATGFLANRGATAAGQAAQAHIAEGNRRQNIAQQVRQTQAQEGDYRTTLRGQLQASERQNQLARATFRLQSSKAAADAANAAAKLQSQTTTSSENRAAANARARLQANTARQGQQTQKQIADANRAAANQRAANKGSGGGGGGKGPSTRSQKGRAAIIAQVEQIKGIARAYPKSGVGDLQAYYNAHWSNIDPTIRQAALEAYTYHHISKATANRLAQIGYGIPGQWQSSFTP